MASVVTGAFGYIGRHIAAHLLESGEKVSTITTHPDKPNPFGESVKASPYNFHEPAALTDTLRGASTLYNTYWVRFEYGGATYQQAIQNTVNLVACARAAGVRKIVHISVTHATTASDLPYYAGKGFQEDAVINSGVSYSIIRPTLVFGGQDILVNNIAWLIRKFPAFPIFGSGEYHVQPVHVDDVAEIAVASGRSMTSTTLDAIGPEAFSFKQLIRVIAKNIRPNVKLIHVRPALGIALGRVIGLPLRDILLTRDELRGLMDGLLTSDQQPNGIRRFSQWMETYHREVGSAYASELGRHFRWSRSL